MLISFGTIKAQFTHGAGITAFIANAEGGSSVSSYGVTYFPRYSFGAFSVGAPISFGISGSYNSRAGASEGSSLTTKLPILVEFNSGLGAADNDSDGFGFFVGGGYGLFSTSYVGTFTFGTLKANGPMARGGVRFIIKEKIIDVGATYLIGGSPDNSKVLGLSAIMRF